MRKLLTSMFFGLACMCVVFTSCEKLEDSTTHEPENAVIGSGSTGSSSQSEEVDTWPAAIDTYVETNYASTAIDYVEFRENEDGTEDYIVHLLDETILIFDSEGAFVSIGTEEDLDEDGDDGDSGDSDDSGDSGDSENNGVALDESELPQAVIDYLAANHADASILNATMINSSTIKVVLSGGTVLFFDLDGNLLDGPNAGNNGNSGDTNDNENNGVTLDESELPQAVMDYLAANYADAEILNATIINDEIIKVVLGGGTILFFDLDGNIVDGPGNNGDNGNSGDTNENNGATLDEGELPQAVMDYLAENHADATILNATIINDEIIKVVLGGGTVLFFDLDGNLVDGPGNGNSGDSDDGDEGDSGIDTNGNGDTDDTDEG